MSLAGTDVAIDKVAAARSVNPKLPTTTTTTLRTLLFHCFFEQLLKRGARSERRVGLAFAARQTALVAVGAPGGRQVLNDSQHRASQRENDKNSQNEAPADHLLLH